MFSMHCEPREGKRELTKPGDRREWLGLQRQAQPLWEGVNRRGDCQRPERERALEGSLVLGVRDVRCTGEGEYGRRDRGRSSSGG